MRLSQEDILKLKAVRDEYAKQNSQGSAQVQPEEETDGGKKQLSKEDIARLKMLQKQEVIERNNDSGYVKLENNLAPVIGKSAYQAQQEADAGTPDEEIGVGKSIWNRLMLGMDMVQKSAWQKLVLDANETAKGGEKSVGSVVANLMGNDWLRGRVRENQQDIEKDIDKIRDIELNVANGNIVSRNFKGGAEYMLNEFPLLLGSSMGMIGASLAGVGVSAAVGAATGAQPGLVAGTISGVVTAAAGLSANRYVESLAEGGDNYDATFAELVEGGMNPKEAHQKALAASDEVFKKNMALLALEVPAQLMAFGPLITKAATGSKIAAKAAQYEGMAAKLKNMSKYYKARYPVAAGMVRYGTVAGLEGGEEGLQYVYQKQATAHAKGEDYDPSIVELYKDDEFRSAVKGGMVLGNFMTGIADVGGAISDRMKHRLGEKQYMQKLKDDQAELQDLLISDLVADGRAYNLKGFLDHTQANNPEYFSNSKDKEVAKKESAAYVAEMQRKIDERVKMYDAFSYIEDKTFRQTAFMNESNRKVLVNLMKETQDDPAMADLNKYRATQVAQLRMSNDLIGKLNREKDPAKLKRLNREWLNSLYNIQDVAKKIKDYAPGAHAQGGTATTAEMDKLAKAAPAPEEKATSVKEVEPPPVTKEGEAKPVELESALPEEVEHNQDELADARKQLASEPAVIEAEQARKQANEAAAQQVSLETQAATEPAKTGLQVSEKHMAAGEQSMMDAFTQEVDAEPEDRVEHLSIQEAKVQREITEHEDKEVDENVGSRSQEGQYSVHINEDGVKTFLGVTDDDITDAELSYKTGTDGASVKGEEEKHAAYARVKNGELFQDESVQSGLAGKGKEGFKDGVIVRRQEKHMRAYDFVDRDGNKYIVAAQTPYAVNTDSKKSGVYGMIYLIPLDQNGKTRKSNVTNFYAQARKLGDSSKPLLWSDFKDLANNIGLVPASQVDAARVGTGKQKAEAIKAREQERIKAAKAEYKARKEAEEAAAEKTPAPAKKPEPEQAPAKAEDTDAIESMLKKNGFKWDKHGKIYIHDGVDGNIYVDQNKDGKWVVSGFKYKKGEDGQYIEAGFTGPSGQYNNLGKERDMKSKVTETVAADALETAINEISKKVGDGLEIGVKPTEKKAEVSEVEKALTRGRKKNPTYKDKFNRLSAFMADNPGVQIRGEVAMENGQMVVKVYGQTIPVFGGGIKEGDTVFLVPSFPDTGKSYRGLKSVQDGNKMYWEVAGERYPIIMEVNHGVTGKHAGILIDDSAENLAQRMIKQGAKPATITDNIEALEERLDALNQEAKESKTVKKKRGKKSLGIMDSDMEDVARDIVRGLMRFYIDLLKKLRWTQSLFHKPTYDRVKRKYYADIKGQGYSREFNQLVLNKLMAGIRGTDKEGNPTGIDDVRLEDVLDATEGKLYEMTDPSYTEEGRELALRMRLSEVLKKVDMPYGQTLKILLDFSKSITDESKLREAYTGKDSTLPDPIKEVIKSMHDIDLNSLHVYAKSHKIYPYKTLRRGKKGVFMISANQYRATQGEINDIKQVFTKNLKKITKGDYFEKAMQQYIADAKKADQEWQTAWSKTAPETTAYYKSKGKRNAPSYNGLVGDIRRAKEELQKMIDEGNTAALPEQYAFIAVMEKDLSQATTLKSTARKIVEVDAAFIADMTGITKEQAIDAMNGQFQSDKAGNYIKGSRRAAETYEEAFHYGYSTEYYNFLLNSLFRKDEYRKKGVSYNNIDLSRRFYTNVDDFVNHFMAEQASGVNYLAQQVTKGQNGNTPSFTFQGVDGKRKNAVRGLSQLELDTQDMVSRQKFFPDNQFVQFHKTAPELVFISGFTNELTNKEKDKSKFIAMDMLAVQIGAFLTNPQADNYYQYIEQMGDKDLQAMVAVPRYSEAKALELLEQRLLQVRNSKGPLFANVEDARKAIAKELSEFDEYVNVMHKASLSNNQVSTELNKKLFYNLALNKLNMDEYYQDSAAFNTYEKQVKRASMLASPGLQGLIGIPGGLQATHNVAIYNDPIINVNIARALEKDPLYKDQFKAVDGFVFHSEQFNSQINVSYGGLYDITGIGKFAYSNHEVGKPEGENGRVVIKGNGVVLTEAFALENGGKNGALYQIWKHMQDNHIDRLTFEATAKAVPAGLVNQAEYTFDKVDTGTEVGSIKFPKDVKVYKADSRYLLLQQDLSNKMKDFHDENMPIQLLRQLMEFPSWKEMAQDFNVIMQENVKKVEKIMALLDSQEPKDKALWKERIKEELADQPGNAFAIELLDDSEITRFHPVIRSIEDTLLSSKLRKTVFKRDVRKMLAIEVPAVGMKKLKGIRISADGKTIEPPQGLIPKLYEDDIVKKNGKKYVIIQRTPTTGPHSITVMEVVGFTPPEMENIIISDRGTQYKAGADNDGDARHIMTKYGEEPLRDANGDVIKDEKGNIQYGPAQGSRGAVNRIWDRIFDEYSKPWNFKYLSAPIKTTAFDKILEKVEKRPGVKDLKTDKLHGWSFNSMMKMHSQNSEAQEGIAMAANARALVQYASQFKFVPKIKAVSLNGKDYVADPRNVTRDRMINIGNAANYVVDNPNVGLMQRLGMSTETLSAWIVLHGLYGVPIDQIIQFFRSPIAQRYMELKKTAGSPVTGLQNNEVENSLISEFSDFSSYAEMKAEFETLTPAEKELWDFLNIVRMGDQMSNLIMFFKKTENGVQSFEDYVTLQNELRKIVMGKGNMLFQGKNPFGKGFRSGKDAEPINENTLYLGNGIYLNPSSADISFQPLYEMMRIKANYYDHGVYRSPGMVSIMQALNQANVYQRGQNMIGSDNTATQIEAYTRMADDMLAQTALGITEPLSKLREEAKRIYEKHIESNPELSKVLQSVGDGITINPEIGEGNPTPMDVREARKEFADIPKKDRELLLKYHALEYGLTFSSQRGGFMILFDNEIHQEMSQKMESVVNTWARLPEEGKVEFLEQLMIMYPDLIRDHSDLTLQRNAYTIDKVKYNVLSRAGTHITNETAVEMRLPTYVKQRNVENGAIEIFKKQEKSGKTVYEKIGEAPRTKTKQLFKMVLPARPTEGGLKNQSENVDNEDLAAQDPQLQEFIRQRLAKLFPMVKVFKDKKAFQVYARNFTTDTVDDVVGSSIADAVFIDPNRAVQSTQVHEHTHLYWDMLPADDKIKQDLMKLFYKDGDKPAETEERVVQAIGVMATQKASTMLRGTALQKFMDLVKTFWSNIKRKLGIATSEDVTRVFASDFWKGIKDGAMQGRKLKNQKSSEEAVTKTADEARDSLDEIGKNVEFFEEYRDGVQTFIDDDQHIQLNRWVKINKGIFKKDANGKPMVSEPLLNDKGQWYVKFDANHYYKIMHAKGSKFTNELATSRSSYVAMARPDLFGYDGPEEKGEFSSEDSNHLSNVARQIGTPVHHIMDQVIGKGVDVDTAIQEAVDMGLLKTDPEILKSLVSQVQERIEEVKKKYNIVHVFTERSAYSEAFNYGFTMDIVMLTDTGEAIIMDFKTSKDSVHGLKYKRAFNSKASKYEAHRTQMLMYAIGLDENKEGTPKNALPIPVKTTFIVPLHYKVKNDEIVDFELEDLVEIRPSWEAIADLKERILEPGKVNIDSLHGFTEVKVLPEAEYAEISGAEKDKKWVRDMTTKWYKYLKMRAEMKRLKLSFSEASANPNFIGKISQEDWDLFSGKGEDNKKLLNRWDRFQKKYETYKKEVPVVNALVAKIDWSDPSKLKLEELMSAFDRIRSYDNAAYNTVLNELIVAITNGMHQATGSNEALADFSPGFLGTNKPFLMAMSDVNEKSPELQYLAKAYYRAMRDMESEFRVWQDEHDRLARKMVQEYRFKSGEFSVLKLLKNYFMTDLSMWEDMWDGEDMISSSSVDGKLLPARKKYLEYIEKTVTNADWVKDLINGLHRGAKNIHNKEVSIHMDPSLMEVKARIGFSAALRKFFGDNHYLEETRIKVKHPATGVEDYMTLGDYLLAIDKQQNVSKVMKELKALAAIRRATIWRNQNMHEDRKPIGQEELGSSYLIVGGEVRSVMLTDPGQRSLTKNMTLESQAHRSRPKGTIFSKNIARSATMFMKDMMYEKYMQGFVDTNTGEVHNSVLDMAIALQAFYQMNYEKDKTFEDKMQFMDTWFNRMQLGIRKEGFLGKAFSAGVTNTVAWTYLTTMTFNLPMAGWNAVMGEFMNLIKLGGIDWLKGNARFIGGLLNGKTSAMLSKFGVESIEQDSQYSANFYQHFKFLATFLIQWGEKLIQGSLFFAQIPDEVWKNLDNQGEVIDPNKPQLTKDMRDQITKGITDLQGKYWKHDKRLYTAWVLGGAAGQFKTWVPDVMRLYFKKHEKNIYGNETEGMVNSLYRQISRFIEMSRDPNSGFKEAMQKAIGMTWDALTKAGSKQDFNTRQLSMELRSMMIIAAVYIMTVGDDDDKEKTFAEKQAIKLFSQLNIFSPKQAVGWLAAPSVRTLTDLAQFIEDFFTMAEYKKNSPGGRDGDLKAEDGFVRLLPYGNMIEGFDEHVVVPLGGEWLSNPDYGKKKKRK